MSGDASGAGGASDALGSNFQTGEFLSLFSKFGVGFVVSSLLSLAYLDRVRFLPSLTSSYLAKRGWQWGVLAVPRFSFHLRWLRVVVQWLGLGFPFFLLAVYATLTIATFDPAIVGWSVLFLGLAALLSGFAMMRWYYQRWVLDPIIGRCLRLAFLSFGAYQVLVAAYRTSSFFSLSLTFMAFSTLPIVYIAFELAPSAGTDMAAFMAARPELAAQLRARGLERASLLGGNAVDSGSGLGALGSAFSADRMDRCMLAYFASLVILAVYAALAWALMPARTHRLGLYIALAVAVADLTVALLARICWHGANYLTSRMTASRAVVLAALSRLLLIISPDTWFLGASAVYVMLGGFLAIKMVDQKFGFGSRAKRLDAKTLVLIQRNRSRGAARPNSAGAPSPPASPSATAAVGGALGATTGFVHAGGSAKGPTRSAAMALGFVSCCFAALQLVVWFGKPSGVPLDDIDFLSRAQSQPAIGMSAFLLVQNTHIAASTVAIILRHKFDLNRECWVRIAVTCVCLTGSGVAMFFLAGSATLLLVGVFGGPLFFSTLMAWRTWTLNSLHLLSPPSARAPPFAPFLRAFWEGGLPMGDYQRVVSFAVALTTLVAWTTASAALEGSASGSLVIGGGALCVALNAVGVTKWHQQMRVGWSVIACIVASTVLLLLGSLLYNEQAGVSGWPDAALLPVIAMLGYPAMLLLVASAYRLYDDGGRVGAFVRRALLALAVVLVLLAAALLVLVSWVAALAALTGMCLVGYVTLLVWAYKAHGNYLPTPYRKSITVVLSLLALLGITLGAALDALFAGLSVTWFAMIAALAGMAVASTDKAFISPNVLPVLAYDQASDDVRVSNRRVLCGLGAFAALLAWSVAATMMLTPYTVGVAVTNITYFFLGLYVADLRHRASAALGTALALLDEEDLAPILAKSVQRAIKQQFELIDGDEVENKIDFFDRFAGAVRNRIAAFARSEEEDVETPRVEARNSLDEGEPGFSSSSRNLTLRLKSMPGLARMPTKLEGARDGDENYMAGRPLVTVQQRLFATAVYIQELTKQMRHVPANVLEARLNEFHADLETVMRRGPWGQALEWTVHESNVPDPQSVAGQPTKFLKFYFNERTEESTWNEPEEVALDRHLQQWFAVALDLHSALAASRWRELKFAAHVQCVLCQEAESHAEARAAEMREFLITQGFLANAKGALELEPKRLQQLAGNFHVWLQSERQKRERAERAAEQERQRLEERRRLLEEQRRQSGGAQKRLRFSEEEARQWAQAIEQRRGALAGVELLGVRFDASGIPLDTAFPHECSSIGEGAIGYGEGRGTIWLRPPFAGSGATGSLYHQDELEIVELEEKGERPRRGGEPRKLVRRVGGSSSSDGRAGRGASRRGDVEQQQRQQYLGWVSPDDVIQGALGDCYLLSAMAVLTAQPQRIADLFVAPDAQAKGCYMVRFWKNGRWEYVLVDDAVPCSEANEQPLYAQSRDGSATLWPLLLEKAYAKYHGSYANIIGGHVSDALLDLSGPDAAAEEVQLKEFVSNLELLWSRLSNFAASGFVMGAHSPESPEERLTDLGIVMGHAYSILRLAEERDENGKHRLVQLRNPQSSRTEWRGAWSDNSSEWTEKMRVKLEQSDKTDGIFWMSLQDLVRQFRTIYVCRLFQPPTWRVHRESLAWSRELGTNGGCPNGRNPAERNPQLSLRLLEDRSTLCFIQLTQEERYNDSGDTCEFPAAAFFLLQCGGRRVRKIGGSRDSLFGRSGNFKKARQISCEVLLKPQPQPYTLLPCCLSENDEGSFTVTIYTNQPVEVAVLDPDTVEVTEC